MTKYNTISNTLMLSSIPETKSKLGSLHKFLTVLMMMFCVISFTGCSDDSKKEEPQQTQETTTSIETQQSEETVNNSLETKTEQEPSTSAKSGNDSNTASNSGVSSPLGSDSTNSNPDSTNSNNQTDSTTDSNTTVQSIKQQNDATSSVQDPEIKTVRIGTSPDYKPLEFIQEGQLVGFEIDVANQVFKKMNYKIEFVQMPFYSLIAALQSNKIDLVVSGMSITEERKQYVDFSSPYYSESNVVISKKSATPDKSGLFSGARVGVQSGSSQESLLKLMLPKYPNITVEGRDNNAQIIQDLRMDKIDSAIVLSSIAQELIKTEDQFVMESIAPDATTQKDFGTAFALPKGSPLTDQINGAIQDLIKDGEIDKLATKWNM